MVDRLFAGLVVRLLDLGLLECMCYVEGTDIETSILVITVAVIKRRTRVPEVVAAAVVVVVVVTGLVSIRSALSKCTCGMDMGIITTLLSSY